MSTGKYNIFRYIDQCLMNFRKLLHKNFLVADRIPPGELTSTGVRNRRTDAKKRTKGLKREFPHQQRSFTNKV